MKNVFQLIVVLDRWKSHFLVSGLLLLMAIFVQMLEPRVLQIAIDGVVNFNENTQQSANRDWVADLLYRFIPSIEADNRAYILLCIGLLFICLAGTKSVIRFASATLAANSTESAVKNLRDKLFRHIQLLEMSHFAKVPSAEIIQRATGDIDTIRTFIGTQTVEFIRMLGIFVLAFIMMASIHFWFAIIAVAILPIILILALYFFYLEAKVWQEHEKEQDKLTAIINENLNGIRVVQAFAQEKSEIDKFVHQNKAKLKIGLKHIDYHKIFWSVTDFLVSLQIAAATLAGAYFVFNNAITLGECVAFYTYAVLVTFPVRAIGRIMTQLGMAAVGIERINQILDAPTEDYQGLAIKNTLSSIEFRNVDFAYPNETVNVLKDVSFKIQANETVALVGPTGSGKSTIISLLTRLYEPSKGEIFINGIPIAAMKKRELRQRLGIVHQEPFLFSTSVKGNITYQKSEFTEAEVDRFAATATVSDFLGKLPNGYDTLVGEKGVTLSGGQKQRVALARTLMGQPDILILDDATTAVDTETEHKIQNGLKAQMAGKTTLIIAQRMTSIQVAKRVLVIENGKITADGTPEELLQKEGFFKKIYQAQTALEAEIENEINSNDGSIN